MPAYTRRPVYRRPPSQQAGYWLGSRSGLSIIELAILTEDGEPIMDEYGDTLVTET